MSADKLKKKWRAYELIRRVRRYGGFTMSGGKTKRNRYRSNRINAHHPTVKYIIKKGMGRVVRGGWCGVRSRRNYLEII